MNDGLHRQYCPPQQTNRTVCFGRSSYSTKSAMMSSTTVYYGIQIEPFTSERTVYLVDQNESTHSMNISIG